MITNIIYILLMLPSFYIGIKSLLKCEKSEK